MDAPHILLFTRIALIIAGGFFINYFIQLTLVKFQQSKKFNEALLVPIKGIAKWFIIIAVVLLICRQLGISLTVILTSLSGILMLVAIGFVGVWSVLSNISCSFLLLLFPPFNFGDTIEIKEPDKEFGMKGKVVGLNLFYTTLKSTDDNGGNTLIRVPNNMFFQRIVICHSGENTEALKVSMRSDYADENRG